MSQPSISLEYAKVDVVADETLGPQTVELALMTTYGTKPSSGDWRAATWLGQAGTSRSAGVLVGPGGLALPVGMYYLWFRITSAPEVPARYAGTFEVT